MCRANLCASRLLQQTAKSRVRPSRPQNLGTRTRAPRRLPWRGSLPLDTPASCVPSRLPSSQWPEKPSDSSRPAAHEGLRTPPPSGEPGFLQSPHRARPGVSGPPGSSPERARTSYPGAPGLPAGTPQRPPAPPALLAQSPRSCGRGTDLRTPARSGRLGWSARACSPLVLGARAGLAPKKSRGPAGELAEMKSAERLRITHDAQHKRVVSSVPAASTGVLASLLLLGGGSQASSSSPLRETDTEGGLGRLLGGGDSVMQVARVRSGSKHLSRI